jgi:hypothetical protein
MSRHRHAPTVDAVETYVIVRREGWRTTDELRSAQRRSAVQAEAMADGVRWIRSYVLAESNGSLGMVCIYEATTPEALRRHAYAASLPVDEIVSVADTVVVQPDPLSVTA